MDIVIYASGPSKSNAFAGVVKRGFTTDAQTPAKQSKALRCDAKPPRFCYAGWAAAGKLPSDFKGIC